jgi:hypothetical protein
VSEGASKEPIDDIGRKPDTAKRRHSDRDQVVIFIHVWRIEPLLIGGMNKASERNMIA